MYAVLYLSGCDLAGVVEEIGEHVKSDVKKGDTVAGFVHGSNLVSGSTHSVLD